jgi:hypothetical protein
MLRYDYRRPFMRFLPSASDNLPFGSSEGALLFLPDGASRQDLVGSRDLLAYVLQNVVKWFDFAKIRRCSISSLFFVTGCDKAKSWGVVSSSPPVETVVREETADGVSCTWTSEFSFSPHARCSPATASTENQCVFVRGLAIPSQESWVRSFALSCVITLIPNIHQGCSQGKGLNWRACGFMARPASE